MLSRQRSQRVPARVEKLQARQSPDGVRQFGQPAVRHVQLRRVVQRARAQVFEHALALRRRVAARARVRHDALRRDDIDIHSAILRRRSGAHRARCARAARDERDAQSRERERERSSRARRRAARRHRARRDAERHCVTDARGGGPRRLRDARARVAAVSRAGGLDAAARARARDFAHGARWRARRTRRRCVGVRGRRAGRCGARDARRRHRLGLALG